MFAVIKKIFLACILALIVLATGAWQGNNVALAAIQNADIPNAPLYPELTWFSFGISSRDITINLNGDTISLPGTAYKAAEQFASGIISQDVLNYYSNRQLAKSGWNSYDAVERPDGVHYIFYHEAGVYLFVEFLQCPRDPSSVCVTVWKSEQADPTTTITSPNTSDPSYSTVDGTFGKTSPANGVTNLNPTSITLSWGTYSPTPDKYSYCVKEGSACDANDPEWTGTYTNTSVTLTNLSYGKTYYWQVKAITCIDCVPKTYVYADGGTWWTFQTRTPSQVTILGNAGVAGAILSYTDSVPKTVTADSTGAYSITVPWNWSGTVTPSKSGYLFSPRSAAFSNLTVIQTIQNFTATVAYQISGNVGVPGATLSYTDGVPQTVTADSGGNYFIMVPPNWSGTIRPSKPGYLFSPRSATFSNIAVPLTIQNFTAIVAYTISGNVGIPGVTLSYTDDVPLTVTADSSSNYIITVPTNWSGTVTPSKTGYTFSPVNRSYVNIAANQTVQNYTPLVSISGNAGIAGATLRYADSTLRTVFAVTADSNGNYTINAPYGWSGTVTPYKTGYTFTPIKRSYANVQTGQTAQSYTAQACIGCADVSISIGGTQVGAYTLGLSQSARDAYPLDSGPVKVADTNAVPIIAALRDAWKLNGQVQSFAQLMGLPHEQLSDTYLFPAYNNVTLSEQIRFANVDTITTTVTVTIAGVVRGYYLLSPNQGARVEYPLDAGPVEIKSSNGAKIIAAIRDAWKVNGQVTSFVQLMGLPKEQLSDTYLFPAYNNVTLDGQLRFGNVDTVPTTVTVTIAGVLVGTYNLNPSESKRVAYPLDAGPVEIKSSGGAKIIAALRDAWKVNGQVRSFAQLMGLPKEALSDTYILPAYNNVTLDGQLRFGNVDTIATTVTVKIAGVVRGTYNLAPSASQRVAYPLDAGPVEIASSNGAKIIVAIRDAWKLNGQVLSFVQMMGLPQEALSTTYWFPAYNNVTLDGQLRFGVP